MRGVGGSIPKISAQPALHSSENMAMHSHERRDATNLAIRSLVPMGLPSVAQYYGPALKMDLKSPPRRFGSAARAEF